MFKPGSYETKPAPDTRSAQAAMRDRCVAYIEVTGGLMGLDRQMKSFEKLFQKLADGVKTIEPR